MNIRSLPVIMLSLVSQAFAADSDPATFSVVPTSPSTTDVVAIKMETEGCYHHPFGVRVDFSERVLEVIVIGQDIGCDSSIPENVLSPRYLDVGLLPSGRYRSTALFCVPAPPPQDLSCSILDDLGEITVHPAGARSPANVPAASVGGLALLAFACMLLGVKGIRRN